MSVTADLRTVPSLVAVSDDFKQTICNLITSAVKWLNGALICQGFPILFCLKVTSPAGAGTLFLITLTRLPSKKEVVVHFFNGTWWVKSNA